MATKQSSSDSANTIRGLGLALMGAKHVNDKAFISDATSRLEAELATFVGGGSIFGEALEVPSAVIDMCESVCETGGESVWLKAAVIGVYNEGYRKIGEHRSVRGVLVGLACEILNGLCATSSMEAAEEESAGADKAPDVIQAEIDEEERMINATHTGNKAAVAALIRLLKERASMKGGCKRLRCKLLSMALNLVRRTTMGNTMDDMFN